MKQITAEDVSKLREETGEGMLACKKILLGRAAQEEKQDMLSLIWACDVDSDLRKILEYLVRKA